MSMTEPPVARLYPMPGPRGFLAHLHFWWLISCVAVFIVPCTLMQIIGHILDPTAKNFKRWAGLWSRLILFCAGIRVRVHQQDSLEEDQPYVFVSNHQTGLDIWAHLVGVKHAFGFVAKAGLRKVPVLGLALRCAQMSRPSLISTLLSMGSESSASPVDVVVTVYIETRRYATR